MFSNTRKFGKSSRKSLLTQRQQLLLALLAAVACVFTYVEPSYLPGYTIRYSIIVFSLTLTCEDVAVVGKARGERWPVIEGEVRLPLAKSEGLLERVVLFPGRLRSTFVLQI